MKIQWSKKKKRDKVTWYEKEIEKEEKRKNE